MPTHNFSIVDDYGDLEYEVDFRITYGGSSPSWEDPGDGPEIEIDSVASHYARSPDGVMVWDKTNPISDDVYERCEQHVLEHFDFNDWYAGMQEDYDRYDMD